MIFCFNYGTKIIKNDSNYCLKCGTYIYEFTKSPSLFKEEDKVYSHPIKRLEDQIRWHAKKARDNKRIFRIYQIITIILMIYHHEYIWLDVIDIQKD